MESYHLKRGQVYDGAHGPRAFDWARVEVRPWHREDRQHWVIVRAPSA